MAGIKLENNAWGVLSASIIATDTSIPYLRTSGAAFPDLGSGEWFFALLQDSDGNREIIKVTAVSPTVLAGISRGQEGTTARSWPAGSRVSLSITHQTLRDAAEQYSFASGTRLFFAQESAPTGWTQVVTDAADNRMLRVVKTAGGSIGGTHSPILNNVVPAHTHGFTTGYEDTNHTHEGYTNGQTADHYHSYHRPEIVSDTDRGALSSDFSVDNVTYIGTSGTSNDHSHYFRSGGVSANHKHSGSTDNGSSQTNWQPRYIDLILCEKD
ncbi:hypothetical protein [Uliginosibacterium sp. 31-12]|uniref:hypothetical protein n=1 Tax=Uliginosibacterium sp. 31-12 TaxID=3062781 RepID=UPI0026E495FB|nr:hypothetical protein [Uliginosibacterium sp. 31-12]MDO6385580.1 hypothetical protein [Uliginosibacterium sp. 31-12]